MTRGIWRDFLAAMWEACKPPSARRAAEVEAERARGVERLAEDVILRNASQRRRVNGR
ncbi:hypothetical protein [Micromonospora sp. CA-248212]|uniref:hypothetical protein n=1 Tax=Micromonospora sp. CA-248212 TaxID=3239961 RepID=UPI003D8E0400